MSLEKETGIYSPPVRRAEPPIPPDEFSSRTTIKQNNGIRMKYRFIQAQNLGI